MRTIYEALEHLGREPSGVLGLAGPDGEMAGAIVSMKVLEEMAIKQMKPVRKPLKKRSTRKERKARAEFRQRESERRKAAQKRALPPQRILQENWTWPNRKRGSF